MKVEELMVRDVLALQADTDISAYEAVELLSENKIGCLVIVHNDEIVGILTERDLLVKVLEKCRNPKETRVSKIMTKHVIVGKPDMEVGEAVRLMFANKVKKLPITDGIHLVGIVTLTDIARSIIMDKKTAEIITELSNMHLIQTE